MWRYWELLLEPLLSAVRPARILEIGVDQGLTTARLLAYAEDRGAVVETIDPHPAIDVVEWTDRHPDALRFHRDLSLAVLPDLAPVDVALIDGDHNWYTVHHELLLLESAADARGVPPPLVVLHDVGWPYGRRDLYYDAGTVPAEHRQPHAVGGLSLQDRPVKPGEGFNAHLDHALAEGGSRNGVLSAVEDFLEASRGDWRLFALPGLSGLGVLAPAAAVEDNGRLRDLVETLDEPPFLRRLVETVERARLASEARRQESARRFAAAGSEGPDAAAAAEDGARLRRELAESGRELAESGRELAEAWQAAEHARRDHEAADRERRRLEQELCDMQRDLGTAQANLAAEVDEARAIAQRAAARARAGVEEAARLRERLETGELRSEGDELQIELLREALAYARSEAELAAAERDVLQQRLASQAALLGTGAFGGDAERPTLDDTLTEAEREARESFLADGVAGRPPATATDADAAALPVARDAHGWVVAEHPSDAAGPTADVVVCVHDALDDLRPCLWSVLRKTGRRFRLIVVNDGSDEQTTAYLRSVAEAVPAVRLIHNDRPPHGYTIAANLGLRASTGDYVVLLNSDTIVTPGWLDRIVQCGESAPSVGVVGPLSNAASHQSIPHLREHGQWSVNPVPRWASPDAIAKLLERVSERRHPRLPFINGFCYAIKRQVIDAIGYFDEELFASGYCEENDYSMRARDAGFELAVADDAYVFHAKSRSFGAGERNVLAKRNYEIFLRKHGRERVGDLVRDMEQDPALAPLRAVISERLSSGADLAAGLNAGAHDPLRVVFVLPGLGAGGSGGSHSVYQEVGGLRRLGLDARIALAAGALGRARETYDDADEIFDAFADLDELAAITADADVIVATHFKSVALVAGLRERRDDFLAAYYVQDYEPFFMPKRSPDYDEALASYTLIEDCVLFAKTHWLCNIVGVRHGCDVAKVEPSIDERLFRQRESLRSNGPLRVVAMVRPRTPRRQTSATVAVLEAAAERLGAGVAISTFGCPVAELRRFTTSPTILDGHRGLLQRNDVADMLAEAHVFVDMSTYQAFGRTSLEAMACGATAIVPCRGGVWEFVEQRSNAIAVDTFDAQQAIDAILELAGDRDLLQRLREAASDTGARYSILKASISEYVLFVSEHRRRFAKAAQPTGAATHTG